MTTPTDGTDRKMLSINTGLKLANAFELMLEKQTSVMVQLAIQACVKDMGEPDMKRLLEDTITALAYGRASGQLFIAMAKHKLGELEMSDGVLEEMENLEDQRDEMMKLLTATRE